MSTKAAAPRRLAALGAVFALCGCATAGSSPEHNHFSALGVAHTRAATADAAPAATPATLGRPAPPADPAAAARRVDAYLTARGFVAEDIREGSARVVAATRMAEPGRVEGEAVCALEALRRPTFSAVNLTVRLAPDPRGVTIAVRSSFAEVNTGVISGELGRETCRSLGVLERGVRRAALGG